MSSVAVGAATAYVVLLLVKSYLAWRRIRWEARERPRSVEPYGLTILQPILSGDETLESSLTETARLAGGGVELVWLVDQDDPEGQRIAAGLEGPGIRVVRCLPPGAGMNPKAVKLARAMEAVTTEFVAVLDDDTSVGRVHLDRAVARLRSVAMTGGLYTGLPTYRAMGGVGSGLVEGFVNSSSALTYLPPLAFGSPITLNGMFYVTARSSLDALGGFEAIRHKLCDDLALARLFQGAGRPIFQGATAQRLVTSGMGFSAYWGRMHRWFVFANVLLSGLRRPKRWALTVALGLPPVLLWAALIAGAAEGMKGNLWPLAMTLLVLIARQLILGQLVHLTREPGGPGPLARVRPLPSIASELLQPLHGIHGALVPTIRWRTRRMRVKPDGTFESLDHG